MICASKLLNPEVAPRAFGDYVVSVDDSGLPQGVTLTKLVS